MAEPYNFENCGTNDPPEILDVTFNVNGIVGTPDFSGAGDQTNPPIIDSNVQVIATWTNEDSEEIVNYQFFLDGSGTVVSSFDSIASITNESLAGETLLCKVTVSNSIGSADFTINMGVIYGLPPVLPDNINSFLTVLPPINSVVAPGSSVSVGYTSQINQLGAPNINSISTIINGESFTGTSFTYTVSADESGNGCEIKIQEVTVSNDTEGIPNTGSDSKSYNLKIATVQSPIAGQPCGEALGRCCWTGGFDSVTGITTGNCDILTSGACDAVNGVWAEGVLVCPTCDGSVGTPCCDEIGTGRCCCVQTDNSGLCIDGLRFDECNSSNPSFANCGGSEAFPDIVWSHNQNCSSSTEPPCQGPPTGRCCEVFADGSGTTCAIGLEQSDCPRYDSTLFAWTPDGNCPDCTVPSQNFGEPCCEPLGRCCLLGDIDSDGFNESLQTPNITERACNQLASDNGYTSINWTQNTPGQSSTNINCNDFGIANANLSCCLPRGRCCWKEPDGTGHFQLNVTEEQCSVLAGSNPRQWFSGTNTSPNCSGNQLSTNLCCDTSVGRCCENNGTQNICTPDVIFDNCNGSGQDFADRQPCPSCDAGVGAPCCNGDATISNITISPDPPVVGNNATISATISNNATPPVYEFTVDGTVKQSGLSNIYNIPRNPNPTSVAGKELICTISTTDFDGEITSGNISRFIDGESFTLPDDLLTINVFPGNLWNGGNGKLTINDNVLVTINASDVNVDPPIRTFGGNLQFQFLDGDEEILDEGTGTSGFIVVNSFNDTCQLKFKVIATNQVDNAPSTGTQEKIYFIGNVFDPTPGTPCGDFLGACCRRSDIDDDPTKGITGWKCDQQSASDCDLLGGDYQGDNTSCPICTVNSSGPCCSEIGTGRCCCTQTDNTGKCVDGLTFGDCNSSNPNFAACGDSPTATPTWFHNQNCPNCAGSIDPPCCAPQTGRCCEILPEGNADGLPPGVTCEIGLEEFDCPRYFSSTSSQWTLDGICPDCSDPQQNFNNPICCPEKLGRCCCTINPDIFEGFCRTNVKETECSALCGGQPPTWTENTSADMPGGLQCPDCSDPANELPCCNDRGRCCYKYEADGDAAREGACHPGVTFGECQFLASQDNALTTPVFRAANPACPNCGAGNNTNSCCNDQEIPLGICCINGVCDDNNGDGVLQTDCVGNFDDSTLVCPNCLDPNENTGQPCCPAGYPVLSIDRILVNGTVYDPSTNPLVGGAVVEIETTEQNLDTVSYEFFIADTSGNTNILSTGSKSYTIPISLAAPGVPVMPGRTLTFEVTATSPIPEIPAEELVQSINIGLIHGTPPTDIELGQIFSFVDNDFIIVPTTLEAGEQLIIFTPPTVTGANPTATISYEWLDNNDDTISTVTSYTVSSDGQQEGCGLKLKITADNTFQQVAIPGGAVYQEIFDIGSIIAGGPDTPCSGINLGTCCCGGVFDSVTGITSADCTALPEDLCAAKSCPGGRTWTDDDYSGGDTFCPTCDTTNQIGLPCCPEYPTGRCCKTGQPCEDLVFRSECDEANGWTWTRDATCPTTPCTSSDPSEITCGCTQVTGACCCGRSVSTNEGLCTPGVSQSECSGPNYCLLTHGVSRISDWYQDFDCNCSGILDPNPVIADCCDGPSPALSSHVGSNSSNTSGYRCTTTSGTPYSFNNKSCDTLSTSSDGDLIWTTSCDYRQVVSNSGDRDLQCDINSVCDCYSACNSGVGCSCTGLISSASSIQGNYNLTKLCESLVCSLDITCCNTLWDETCAALAFSRCNFSDTGFINDSDVVSEFCDVLNKDYPNCSSSAQVPCVQELGGSAGSTRLEWTSCKNALFGSNEICNSPRKIYFGQYCTYKWEPAAGFFTVVAAGTPNTGAVTENAPPCGGSSTCVHPNNSPFFVDTLQDIGVDGVKVGQSVVGQAWFFTLICTTEQDRNTFVDLVESITFIYNEGTEVTFNNIVASTSTSSAGVRTVKCNDPDIQSKIQQLFNVIPPGSNNGTDCNNKRMTGYITLKP
jgi:hypothetical protein